MRNRDIVFALKMVNRSKPALTAFSGDFRRAARDAQVATKSLGRVSSALDRVGSSSARSGAQIGNAATNMRKALVTIQQQAKQTQSALQAAFGVQPGANSQQASRRSSSDGSRRNARTPLVNGSPTGWGNGIGQMATLKRGFDEATRSAGALQTTINGVIGLITVGFGTKKLLDTADTYTQLRGQITLVSRSQEEMNAVYERTFAIAQNTRQSFDGTVQLYARLHKATETSGYSANQLLGVTETINKALATTPGPAGSAEAALLQLSQGLAAGALRGEELNSVLEQAPRLAKAIADGMGVPVGSLKKMAEQNKLTADAVVKAIMSQRSAIDSEFSKLDKTASQAFTILGNAMVDFVGRADKASGATSSFADIVTNFAGRLRDPELMANAIRGFEALSSLVGGLGTIFTAAVNHIDLVIAALAMLGARMLLLPFGALISGAWNLGAALVSLASGAGLAATGFTALQLSLGVAGVVLTAVAGAFAYFSASGKQATATTNEVREALTKAAAEGKSLTEVVTKLSDAKRFKALTDIGVDLAKLEPQLKSTADGIAKVFETAKARGGRYDIAAAFGDFGSTLTGKQLAPFQQAIDGLVASIRAGKPEAQAFIDEVNRIAATSGDAGIQKNAQLLERYATGLAKAAEEMSSLRKQQEALKGVEPPLDAMRLQSGAQAIQTYGTKLAEMMKTASGPMKEAQQALEDVAKATELYKAAVEALDRAHKAGEISWNDYRAEMERANGAFAKAKDAINGVTEAQREMRKLQTQNGIDGMAEGRAKKLAELKQKYDELAEGIRKSVHNDEGAKQKLLLDLEKQRAVAIGNIDAAYRNGAFADRLRDLDNERRLLGLTGEEREREVKRIEVENEARRAGVGDVNALTNAYMQQYDMLKKLQDQSNQSFGAGFSNAMKSYVNETKNVTKESEKLWGGVFSKMEDAIVEFTTTGKLNLQSFLNSIAQDFARFAARQLMRSIFGLGDSGGSGGGGWLGEIASGISKWFPGSSSSSGGSSSGSVLPSIVQMAVGGPSSSSSSGIGSAVSALASAPTSMAAVTKAATGLDQAFSERLSKFMADVPGLSITSGFRSTAQQAALYAAKPHLAAPPGSSLHEKGFAADLAYNGSGQLPQWVRDKGADYGIEFPLANRARNPEPWHAQPLNARELARGASAAQSAPLNYTSDMSKYTLDQSTIEGLEKQFGDISSSASTVAPNLKNLDTSLTDTAAKVGQSGTDLNNGVQQASNSMQQGGAQVGSALTTTAATTTVGGTAVGTGLTTTAGTVTAGGAQIGAAMQTAAANIQASGATGGGGGGILGLIGGFFGSGGAGFDVVARNHSGGLAGKARSSISHVDTRLFSQARRFHTGGIPGLKSNEEAIIAEKDEALLPTVRLPNGKFGVSAAGIGGGRDGPNIGDVTVNITMEGGSSGNTQQDAEQAKRIGKEVKDTFKGLMAEWTQDNSRPGGVLFKGA